MYHARGIIMAAETQYGETQQEIEALKEGDEQSKVYAENWSDGLTYCKFEPAIKDTSNPIS